MPVLIAPLDGSITRSDVETIPAVFRRMSQTLAQLGGSAGMRLASSTLRVVHLPYTTSELKKAGAHADSLIFESVDSLRDRLGNDSVLAFSEIPSWESLRLGIARRDEGFALVFCGDLMRVNRGGRPPSGFSAEDLLRQAAESGLHEQFHLAGQGHVGKRNDLMAPCGDVRDGPASVGPYWKSLRKSSFFSRCPTATDFLGDNGPIVEPTFVIPSGRTFAAMEHCASRYAHALGTPAGEIELVAGAAVKEYADGFVCSTDAGTFAVFGELAKVFRERQAAGQPLGWPTSPPGITTKLLHDVGLSQCFDNATVTMHDGAVNISGPTSVPKLEMAL